MNLSAVTISKEPIDSPLRIPHLVYTQGWKPIARDNTNIERFKYTTDRYNRAIAQLLERYPATDNILLVDSYYLNQPREIARLIADYTPGTVLGGSVWYRQKKYLFGGPILYYDTMSVREYELRQWHQPPNGIVPVSAVGACWIFPRECWEASGGFRIIRERGLEMCTSRCINSKGRRILLDQNVKLWRTHETNPTIRDYPLLKRARMSFGRFRRRIV